MPTLPPTLLSSLHRLLLLCCALGLLLCAQGVRALSTSTTLITRGLDGGPALTAAETLQVAVSDDGRYVAFLSNTTSFGGNPEGRRQVYVRDRQTDQVTVASRSTGGSAANRDCVRLALSRDGRFVAFASEATNLDFSTAYPALEVYVHDRHLGKTEVVSLPAVNAISLGNSGAAGLAISADGRYVAFSSQAPLMVPDDTNGALDVFVRDRTTGQTERVSLGAGTTQGNSRSGYDGVGLSDDGRYVTFSSFADNLVAGDHNAQADVFVRDRQLGLTTRVSVTNDGGEADAGGGSPSISADGSRVAFTSASGNLVPGDTNLATDLFVRDRSQGRTVRASVDSNGAQLRTGGSLGTISPDGGTVAFWTSPPPEQQPGPIEYFSSQADVLVHDLTTQVTELVSLGADGQRSSPLTGAWQPPVVASGGRFVTWISLAGNLAEEDTNLRHDAYLRDRTLAKTEWISAAPQGTPGVAGASSTYSALTPDGRFVAFTSDATNLVADDTNGLPDVFVWDRQTGVTERVSVSNDGVQGDGRSGDIGGVTPEPKISADGRFVAFASAATNLVPDDQNHANDSFVRDRLLGVTERVSVANDGRELPYGSQGGPGLSADGRLVAFASYEFGLAGGPLVKTNILVRDRQERTTERVSLGLGGAATDGDSYDPALSADGRFVAFSSTASNLVPRDVPDTLDVFVHDRLSGATEQINVNANGAVANAASYQARISADGRYVLFLSSASNLNPADYNQQVDAFVRDRLNATTTCASVSVWGAVGSEGAPRAALSPDGRFVAFTSASIGLVPEGQEGLPDVYVRDLDRSLTERASVASDGTARGWRSPDGRYVAPALGQGGRYVVFSSDASTLVAEDHNGGRDLFFRDRGAEPVQVPTALTATLQSENHISLRWTDESLNETAFHIERQDENGSFIRIGSSWRNVAQYEDYSVRAPGPYTYRVQAESYGVLSRYSNEVAVTYPPPPAAPTDLTVKPQWPSTIVLSWRSGSEDTTGYRVERSQSENGPFSALRGTTAPTYTDVGVTDATTYYYRVAATNAGGRSPYSEVVAAISLPSRPYPPGNLRAARVTEDWISLAWDDDRTVEDGYRIERRSPGGAFAEVGRNGVNQLTFIDTGLPAGTRFEYRVVSFNRAGEAASMILEVTTRPGSGGKLLVTRKVDFGQVKAATTRTRSVSFRNRSATQPLRVTLGAPEAPFSIADTDRSFVVAPRSYYRVVVTYLATDRVRTTKRWVGQSGDPKQPVFEIRLSGAAKAGAR